MSIAELYHWEIVWVFISHYGLLTIVLLPRDSPTFSTCPFFPVVSALLEETQSSKSFRRVGSALWCRGSKCRVSTNINTYCKSVPYYNYIYIYYYSYYQESTEPRVILIQWDESRCLMIFTRIGHFYICIICIPCQNLLIHLRCSQSRPPSDAWCGTFPSFPGTGEGCGELQREPTVLPTHILPTLEWCCMHMMTYSVSCRIAFVQWTSSLSMFSDVSKSWDFVGRPTFQGPQESHGDDWVSILKIMENHFKTYLEIHQDCIIKVELISASCLHITHRCTSLSYIIKGTVQYYKFNSIYHISCITISTFCPPQGWYWSASEGLQVLLFGLTCKDQWVYIINIRVYIKIPSDSIPLWFTAYCT